MCQPTRHAKWNFHGLATEPAVPCLACCADDEDNYVVGMGLDFTSTGVTVEHPTDPNAPDLPPQPVLLVRPHPPPRSCVAALCMHSPAQCAAPCSLLQPARMCCLQPAEPPASSLNHPTRC